MSALSLASCAPRKLLTRVEAVRMASERMEARADSLVRERVAALTERLTETEGGTVTEITLYDTDKADSTGKPPVKATVRREHRQRQREAERSSTATEAEAATVKETALQVTDSTRAGVTEEKKPTAGTGILRTGAGVLLLAVALLIFLTVTRRNIKRQQDTTK